MHRYQYRRRAGGSVLFVGKLTVRALRAVLAVVLIGTVLISLG